MREFNFTKYFMYLLYDHRQVLIPGLGIFTLERKKAYYRPGEEILEPPSYNISFKEDKSLSLDEGFLKKLRIYSPRLSKQEYLEFAITVTQALQNNQKFLLNNIGTLYMNGGQLIFEEEKTTTHLLTQHYPKLNLKFFTKPLPLITWLDLKLASLPHKFWTYVLPFFIMTILVLTIGYFGIQFDKTSNFSKIPIPVNDPPVVITDTSQIIEDKLDSLLGSTGNVQIDSVGMTNEGEIIKRCIIITGAYRSELYKNIMIQKIEDLGYNVFIQDINGLIRVGIEFECTDATLTEMLEKIRSTIEKNAWHLENKEG